MARSVQWYESRVRRFTYDVPVAAHKIATAQAAGLAARTIKSTYSGTLARDLSRPRYVGFLHAYIGSNLPYAAMENWGGIIKAKGDGRMLIRGRRGGTTRSTFGGPITASAKSVRHRGKHFLELAAAAFPGLYLTAMRRMMPK